jgi:hypothetical protein
MIAHKTPRLISIKNQRIINASKKQEIQIKKAIKSVLNYFDEKFFPYDFFINVVNTREQMDECCGYKTQNWVCGNFNMKEMKVSIFQENLFGKVTPHPKKEFNKVLTHELVHLYTKKKFQLKFPVWLSEGLAMTVAKQCRSRYYRRHDIRGCYGYDDWAAAYPYHSSVKFVEYLLDSFGKDKLLALLEALKGFENKASFQCKFKETYRVSFDFIIEEWLEMPSKVAA